MISVKVPKALIRGGLSAARAAKNALVRAIEQEAKATGEPPASGTYEWATIHLSERQREEIRKAAERDGLSESRWMEVILARAAEAAAKRTHEKLRPWMRPEQDTIARETIAAAQNHEILLAQAGTGIGKTRAMLVAAMEVAAMPDMIRAVLAFPSIQTVAHAVAELGEICRQDGCEPDAAVILGSGQFCSERRLRDMLSENTLPEDEAEALARWLDEGAPPVSAASRAIAEIHPISHLLHDVEALAPSLSGLELQSIALASDEATEKDAEKDRGAAAYRAPRNLAAERSLVLCTHAMLGCHLRASGEEGESSILPLFSALYVDEAHLLESNVAMALTTITSLHMLKLRLDRMAAPSSRKNAKAAVTEMEQFCRDWLRDVQEQTLAVISSDDDPRVSEMKRMATGLHRHAKNAARRAGSSEADLMLMRRDIAVLGSLAHPKTTMLISSTPVEKKWRVSVGTGPASVRAKLRRMFASLKTGALFSASLAVPDAKGRWNYGYMQTVLGVPPHRARIMPPIEHAWGYNIPTVICAMSSQLVRPGDNGAAADDARLDSAAWEWIASIAEVISTRIAPDAVGGTLVLATGYRMLHALAELLQGDDEINGRLIEQHRGDRITALKERFKAEARAGNRPIWLATGTAWTGLDLRDDSVPDSEAARDTLLTDLVIPAVQVSLGRTTTWAVRSRRKLRMNALAAETFFATMQGMGRLMRRKGVRDRRLWILDPRIWDDDPKRKRWLLPLRKYVEKYPKREWL